MPRLSFGIDADEAAGAGIAEGFSDYSGDLPPAGSYKGVLKVLRAKKITGGENKGKHRLQIGVEITDPRYKGYFAWGGVNLIDSGLQFVNQFLNALGDGSDASLKKLQKALFGPGPVVDDTGNNVEVKKIGTVTINSPKGERPMIVSLKRKEWPVGSGEFSCQINGYSPITSSEDDGDDEVDEGEEVEEANVVVDVESEDETDTDDGDAEEGETVEEEDAETIFTA